MVARYANEVSNYYVDMNYHGVLGRACQVGAELKMQVDSSRVTRRLTRVPHEGVASRFGLEHSYNLSNSILCSNIT